MSMSLLGLLVMVSTFTESGGSYTPIEKTFNCLEICL